MSQERVRKEVLVWVRSFKRASLIANAINEARDSRPKPSAVYGSPVAHYVCWKSIPRFWTAYRGWRGWLTGPWEKHIFLPPWKVSIVRWPEYEDYPFKYPDGRQTGERVVSRDEIEAFAELARKPWLLKRRRRDEEAARDL